MMRMKRFLAFCRILSKLVAIAQVYPSPEVSHSICDTIYQKECNCKQAPNPERPQSFPIENRKSKIENGMSCELRVVNF
jgi:hypothetical protein